jgi:diketogulonate reductase-like aldo/keto reductase
LRRLRTEVVDLNQIRWPNPEEEIVEGWSAMAELTQLPSFVAFSET